ncbi:CTP synthase [Candidatus Giovannonibacteria bacterium RIFCSPLOWO2_02_FULL_43_11b]|uniref:CTP synthase n=1 Tax=Candidatus Giovannonibacteria bacterium RIFCSPHIGHO2_12_FULL_43_15 TaxID=1798341 RepID=A0A1F5WRE4_9BACT|nr:MAG: CTP synthase [Candidatus Giovannonibacteria bacterium RIFCSPHIGHO2_01_FULL_43_100]OGF67246.1 MAG: CTP synthase [Candidatus Giovannonibacteria bacterium RIFCSPHIGHO2_02_FULL_43_32]OGF78239.1 MAG: CTP synthase [Candidatus Giovannonibacteria bacterium RIFCSPHIGHO2_12_FULL_43_15]OGF78744.1 MAG: CTP synthase [Candidatus Giovannonibacteria bacterium RIFCSPLOWO2_01_FULL_43_60]OGF90308.1 MAG: CTP synthase [Candidatus Giovannonibacteria bacterium RIFCSPLOWO2_02_FULL_43_11b]OGF92166.1 MAG: CTP s
MPSPRFIFVIGGVMSGIGKGIASASTARILKSKGYKTTCVKIDPYLNVDAGTMNPIEHGEVFVTEDGMETDQDIGNYERFLDENIFSENYMTSGSVYLSVIEKERALKYNGDCVQIVPHVPEEVIRRLKLAARKSKADFVLVEIGGTAGEYENILFLEAARMMHLKSPKDVLFMLISYFPIPTKIGEMKTKPTQHAVRALNSVGIQPDFIIARAEVPLDEPRKKKLSVFCNVHPEDVISAPDIENIYQVPLNLEKEKLGAKILKKFDMKEGKRDMKEWARMVRKALFSKKEVNIGIVGKYFGTGKFTLSDSYISVIEAIKHASWQFGRIPKIFWLDAEAYEKNPERMKEELGKLDGIIVPGGFGSRGIEGKIKAITFARKNKKPYLGLCYGMQLAVIEFARNVAGMKGANTTEVNARTKYPVIDLMAEQKEKVFSGKMGGTMRLGAYACRLKDKTIARRAYGVRTVYERHRHRYEFNEALRSILESKGLVTSGINTESGLVEIIELKDHPFFLGTQFHPEFKSRPLNPHPLFREFIKAVISKKK